MNTITVALVVSNSIRDCRRAALGAVATARACREPDKHDFIRRWRALETELLVELRHIGDQADIGTRQGITLNGIHDLLHNPPPQTLTAMFGNHRDVDDLEEASAVANDASHADRLALMNDRYRE